MLRFLVLVIASLAPQIVLSGPTSSRLNVHVPRALFKQGGYDHREALFGMPPYGGSIVQNVYYADSTLCDSNVDTSKGYPERPLKPDGTMQSWPSPFILMVDRGDCTFVRKVRNAQRSGAAAVVIADNSCLCSAGDECTDTHAPCESAEPILADDGSGRDISIPAMLMFKQDADKIKEVLKTNQPVQMELSWALPNPDDRVEYEIWTTPVDSRTNELFRTFKDAVLAFGRHAYFTPHMYIFDGIKSGCTGGGCYNLCTNDGRYCATDPDNDLEHGISGADVVTESLRRMCIWKVYGEADGQGLEWWDYVNSFSEACSGPSKFMDEECVTSIYEAAKIDATKIEDCMRDSGGLKSPQVNSLLAEAVTMATQRGVVVIPTAFINTAAIRGALDFGNIFDAVCAGFQEGTAPPVCRRCVSNPNTKTCVRDFNKNPDGPPPDKKKVAKKITKKTTKKKTIKKKTTKKKATKEQKKGPSSENAAKKKAPTTKKKKVKGAQPAPGTTKYSNSKSIPAPAPASQKSAGQSTTEQSTTAGQKTTTGTTTTGKYGQESASTVVEAPKQAPAGTTEETATDGTTTTGTTTSGTTTAKNSTTEHTVSGQTASGTKTAGQATSQIPEEASTGQAASEQIALEPVPGVAQPQAEQEFPSDGSVSTEKAHGKNGAGAMVVVGALSMLHGAAQKYSDGD